MACNSCAKTFNLLRKEKGCPGCGFSYCSKCLDNKVFLPKLHTEANVCSKCKRLPPSNELKQFQAPDAYYKRMGLIIDTRNTTSNESQPSSKDEEIQNRLQKLKENRETAPGTSNEEIHNRLQKVKDIPKVNDAELQERLARLRDLPVSAVQNLPVISAPDNRTEQEQADDLMKQYMEKTNMDTKYNVEFENLVKDMESRLGKLKNAGATSEPVKTAERPESESEDEESAVRKIVDKIKAEASLDSDELPPSTNDELPFCEICNDDATLRCLGCRYLFCKRCFMEHKDDDDGCNRYEPYKAFKNV